MSATHPVGPATRRRVPRGSAATHFAFAITAEDVEPWKERLASEGVADWPHGATSIDFRDPDGNLAELISPGFWAIH